MHLQLNDSSAQWEPGDVLTDTSEAAIASALSALVGQDRAEQLIRRAELVDHERYATRAAAMKSIGDYIDNFYNVERRHSHLGYLNPIEFELRGQLQQQVA